MLKNNVGVPQSPLCHYELLLHCFKFSLPGVIILCILILILVTLLISLSVQSRVSRLVRIGGKTLMQCRVWKPLLLHLRDVFCEVRYLRIEVIVLAVDTVDLVVGLLQFLLQVDDSILLTVALKVIFVQFWQAIFTLLGATCGEAAELPLQELIFLHPGLQFSLHLK